MSCIPVKITNLSKIDTLILNAAECEPYITSDDRLLQERASEVVAGLEILMQVLDVSHCLIGIEDNKPEAIASLQKALDGKAIQLNILLVAKNSSSNFSQIKKFPSAEFQQILVLFARTWQLSRPFIGPFVLASL